MSFSRAIAGSSDLAFEAALAEAARDQHAVEVVEATCGQQALDVLRLYPIDLDLGTVMETGVLQALDDRKVCVGQADVLADETDLDGRCGLLDHRHDLTPWAEIDRSLDAQHVAHDVVEALVVQDQRQFVDVAAHRRR